jgi:hypothetical protein
MKLTAAHWTGIAGAAGGIGLGVWWWFNRSTTEADVLSEDPTTPDSPLGLANAAGVTPVVYALARAIQSEAGGQPQRAQIAVGWTIQNYADAHKGGDILSAVLGSASVFGPQGTGGRGYVASSKAPTSATLALAAQIVAEQIGDPTGGAINFDSPHEQDREFAAGTSKKDAARVAVDRQNSGLVAYDVDVAGADFRFWGPA